MTRRLTRILLYGLAFLTIAGVGGLLWHLREQRIAFYTDADTIRRRVDEAETRDILWTPPVAVEGHLNTSEDEYEPRVTSDGLTMFLVRGRAGENTDIYVSTRTPDGWSDPVPLDAVNGDADELGPEPTRDGKRLYFASNRVGGLGGYDLWVVERRADEPDGWGDPVNLGPNVNTAYHEYSPAVAPDGLAVWFSSNRPGANDIAFPGAEDSVTLREDLYEGDFDLFRTRLTNDAPATAERVDALSSPAEDGAPAISPNGDFIYFSSDRAGGHGSFDIYRARLTAATLGATGLEPARLASTELVPINLGTPVNSPAAELDPSVSLGGFGLHFSSNRPHDRTEDEAGVDRRSDLDLHYATSREVYTATEVFRATIDWFALITYALFILIALLALLLVWSLTRVLRSERYRTLGLLARCLIASLMIHALLLVGLAFWGVGNSLSEWMDRGGTRVAIVSPSVGNELAAQVRGSVTDVTMNAEVEAAQRQTAEVAPLKPQASAAALAVAQTAIEPNLPVDAPAPSDAPAPTAEMQQSEEPADVDPASALALELPEDARPAPAAEAEANVEVEADMPSPVRLAVETPAASADAMSPVVSTPAPSVAAQMAGAETIAADQPARDALPPAPHVATAAAVADRPARLEPNLPMVPEAPVDRAEETERRVAAFAGTKPSAQRPVPGTESAIRPARVDVTPDTSSGPPAEGSLAAVVDVDRVAGAPAAAMPRPDAPSPVPASPSTSVALPAMEELKAAAQTRENAEPTREAASAAPSTKLARAERRRTGPVNPAATRAPNIIKSTPAATPAAALLAGSATVADATGASRPAPGPPAPRVRDPGPGPSALALDFDLPAPNADVAPPSVEAGDAIDSTDVLAPLARRTVDDRPDDASAKRVDFGTPNDSAFDPALASSLATVAAMSFTVDAPRAIDLPALEVHRVAVPSAREVDLDVPEEQLLAPSPQRQRAPEVRLKLVEEMGGSAETERAVAMSLDWLARHQSADGRWDSDGYDRDCHARSGATRIDVDIALTGLALLCYFATDNTHVKDGPYRDNVTRALAWLRSQQKQDGDLLGDESMYSHGIATIALAEAYGMTGDPELREPLELAVDFIVAARNRRGGGWRYAPGQAGDTSVLGWQVMALKSAESAGLDVDPDGFAAARRWLDSIGRMAPPGLFVYQPGREPSPAMTAEGMFVQQLLGVTPDPLTRQESINYIREHPPVWNFEANTYYWYYATLALYQQQGESWRWWNEKVKEQLLAHQIVTGRAVGSWNPNDQWSRTGGRVYQTAICTLTLEVYYRYLPQFVQTAGR